jgi:hypothetical protein
MKTFFKYLLLGIGAYLFFLILNFPAQLGYHFLEKKLPPNITSKISITEISETWHNGRAGKISFKGYEIKDLDWKLRLQGLLFGELQVNMDFLFMGSKARMTAGISPGHYRVTDLSFAPPIEELNRVLSDYGVKLKGDFKASFKEIKIKKDLKMARTDGIITWANGSVIEPQKLPLGDFKALIKDQKSGIKVLISDNKGHVKLDGIINIKQDKTYQADISIGPRDSASSDLKTMLSFLGARDTNGNYKIKYNGSLNGLL